ncbi:bifunctional folylpolyglutamate synthase/dihydrofolate synthase, partial [Limnospira platensis]|nr:bifunctional folylpolyglutamate synthase/dihydrofolate synthase [Arthrospira platensis FACHB-835]
REKAGILKRGCPAVVGPLPPEARKVVNDRLLTLGCPTTWVEPAQLLKSDPFHPVASYGNCQYILPMPGQVQLLNSALAIAVLESLKQQGWAISDTAIVEGIAKTRWPGRLQWISCHDNRSFLLDGAHNPAAAAALREYVDELQQRGTVDGPITWVMGMLSTKDHDDIFRALLHSGDRLHLVPVPDHSSAIPEQLAHLAHQICPQLGSCQTHSDPIVGLETALANSDNSLVVLCGSLYLVGYILKAVSSGGGGH